MLPTFSKHYSFYFNINTYYIFNNRKLKNEDKNTIWGICDDIDEI